VTLAVYYLVWKESLFNPGLVYDYIGEIFSVLVIASYVATILLYCKGHMAPSSEDWGSSGNILGDIFWGMELYPRITSHFDIKVFLNCRFAVMAWAMLVISFAIKQVNCSFCAFFPSCLLTSPLVIRQLTANYG
jgi:7-dehydrocholesterol reductase